MKEFSNDAIVAVIKYLLNHGWPPSKVAEQVDVSLVRLVEIIGEGRPKHADAVLVGSGRHAVPRPLEIVISSGGVSIKVGRAPRWALSLNAQSAVPSVRATAPYLDVAIDMKGEELVAYESAKAYAPSESES